MRLTDFVQENIFSEHVEQKATRDGFGTGLKQAGDENTQVVAVCADLTESTRIQEFAEAFPGRFVQVGVAEQNMSGVASGLAAMGKVAFMASYAMFSPGRNWEQIRTTIAYNNVSVKIIGAHAGISVGPDGATHQAIEDMALMRAMPNMIVIAPCDAREAHKATLALAKYSGPAYMRVGREKTPLITTTNTPFEIGKAQIFLERGSVHTKTVGIIACGSLVYQALVAARALDEQGIGASVMNLATIKPLDEQAVRKFAEEHDALITVEEHQKMGGMGSAVAEYLSSVRPTKIIRVGVDDVFGQSGTPDELIVHYKMDSTAIIAAAHEALHI